MEAQLIAGYCGRKQSVGRTPRQDAGVHVLPENVSGHESVKIEGRKKVYRQFVKIGRKTQSGGPIETTFMCKICKVPLCWKSGCHAASNANNHEQ